MTELVRHRQTKEPETDRPHLNHRATSRLYWLSALQNVVTHGTARFFDHTVGPIKLSIIGTPPFGQSSGLVAVRFAGRCCRFAEGTTKCVSLHGGELAADFKAAGRHSLTAFHDDDFFAEISEMKIYNFAGVQFADTNESHAAARKIRQVYGRIIRLSWEGRQVADWLSTCFNAIKQPGKSSTIIDLARNLSLLGKKTVRQQSSNHFRC